MTTFPVCAFTWAKETLVQRVRYSVVMSLDGYIAGPKGEADWISTDPEFDLTALFSQFDTIFWSGGTFDAMVAAGRVSIPV